MKLVSRIGNLLLVCGCTTLLPTTTTLVEGRIGKDAVDALETKTIDDKGSPGPEELQVSKVIPSEDIENDSLKDEGEILNGRVLDIEQENAVLDNRHRHLEDSFIADLHVGAPSPTAGIPTAGAPAAADKSKNLYAIAYEPGVTVYVTNDHLKHTPPNRIDMSGTSGGPYKIVAALDGKIMYIQDGFRSKGECETNNYVWIAHANGEWTKYSHMTYQSTTVDAGLKVGDTVSVGQFLGYEGEVGCASGPHLHWEVAVPNDLADPIQQSGGYIKGKNLIPQICGIKDNLYVSGVSYTVPRVRPGWSEYARHGLSDSSFQADFDAAAQCNFIMDWNNGYDDGFNNLKFNVVYHPNKSPTLSWYSHRKLTKSQLNAKKNSYGSNGFKLVHIDVYRVGNSIRYAAIFKKGNSIPTTLTYYGVSAATHQSNFDTYTSQGWKPRVISVTSTSNNSLIYAAVYTKQNIGSWLAKSFQTSAEYQSNYNQQKNQGRKLIYLKSYVNSKKTRYSAIWAKKSGAKKVYAKHGLTSASYQTNYNTQLNAGYKTRSVSATRIGKKTRFAAYWNKK